MTKCILLSVIAFGLSSVGSVCANDDVREVQTKLRDGGFYSGEIDGAYSSALAGALTRYQIRNGLPVTGQLDIDTSKALGAKPAVTTRAQDPAQSSEIWQQLRKSKHQSAAKSKTETTPSNETNQTTTERTTETTPVQSSSATGSASKSETQPQTQSRPVHSARVENTPQASTAEVSAQRGSGSSAVNVNTDRLHDYVTAFVLAGLDPHVGAEVDFFADRVRYYDDGIKDRAAIRKDLQRYAAHWPERRFWIGDDIKIDQEDDNRLRVTFPLRYELRNGSALSSGKLEKSLVLEVFGEDDFQIVAVNERQVQ
jgi:hypothetical protein